MTMRTGVSIAVFAITSFLHTTVGIFAITGENGLSGLQPSPPPKRKRINNKEKKIKEKKKKTKQTKTKKTTTKKTI